jgi:hypothetical protein
VAKNFALRPSGNGVVLTAQVPVGQARVPTTQQQVSLTQSPGAVVSESEVQVVGEIQGAKVQPIKKQNEP